VLALGRPGARPSGVAPHPVEPPQLAAAPEGHLPHEPPLDPPQLAAAPEGHLPQEPPSDPPQCHPQLLRCHFPRSWYQSQSHSHPHCPPMP
jgi:hypothetical protein